MTNAPYAITVTIPALPGCTGPQDIAFTDAARAAAERLTLFAQYCGQCGQARAWCQCQWEADPTRKPGYINDKAVELYYRQRAAGGKATLKEIAIWLSMNYANLLKHKQRYDRAGKWGAKSKAKT